MHEEQATHQLPRRRVTAALDRRGTSFRSFIRRRSLGACVAGLVALVGFVASPVSGSANNDPHRVFAPSSPFDLPSSYCGFPVHVATLADNEYETVTTLADGTTVIKTTGRIVASVTNETSGKTVIANASGPGMVTVSPDGSTALFDDQGLAFLIVANATGFGFPSDLVITSGEFVFTADLSSDTITSVTRQPHVLTDLCAAVAS